jgi:WD40 repeat protein
VPLHSKGNDLSSDIAQEVAPVAHIVCIVESEDKKVTFKWSDGTVPFEPYELTGPRLELFRQAVRKCREQLDGMAQDYLAWVNAAESDRQARNADLRKTCFLLAQAGYDVYGRLFRPDEPAKTIRNQWLEPLRDRGEVESLELVLDGDPGVPWNVVYDSPPAEKGFLSGDGAEAWRPFWGVRYNLAAGYNKVEPLRRVPAPAEPCLRMVVDRSILDGLPGDQRKDLLDFAAKHGCEPLIHTRQELEGALAAGRPDLLYWLSHATPEALQLDGEPVPPLDLFTLLEKSASDNATRFPGLVFLNACRTAESPGGDTSFLSALEEAKCSGVIATEQQTINTFASPLGLDFLKAFLDRGETVGAVMQMLRGRVPMGLVYATYCPPHIRKAIPAAAAKPAIAIPQPVPGIEMAAAAPPPRPPLTLPKHPYRSLSYYDREDRALFAGRDGDVLRFCRILDESATRVLVLHGESGCGKSSFLRAGVIPFLEEECVGYRFLRDRSQGDSPSVWFIRATNDLPGQIADALVRFCGQPLSLNPPRGQPVKIDLPVVLGERRDVSSLRQALLAAPALLGRLLAEIGQRLPFTPVLVIDQAEEVFTLAHERGDEAARAASLEMLRQASETAGRFKVVIALRTEYYGRFVDGLRRGVRPAYGVREYLLTDLDEGQLTEAILRPTRFGQYGFRYAGGMAQKLAADIVAYCRNRQDSVLPLAQVICTQLHERVRHRPDRELCDEDVAAIGGIEGGMKRHVEELMARHVPHAADRAAIRRLLARLYLRQPDGTLTTGMMPEKAADGGANSVERCWKGRLPLPQVLETMRRPDVRLLRASTLRTADGKERGYYSLGHDAVAKVAADWDEEAARWARVRNWAAVTAAMLLVAAAMAVLAGYAAVEAKRAEDKAAEAKDMAKKADSERNRAREALGNLYRQQIGSAIRAKKEFKFAEALSLLVAGRPGDGGDDWRGFEWYCLWRQCDVERGAALRHIDSGSGATNSYHVKSIALDPGRNLLAAGTGDSAVWVWDLGKGRAPVRLPGHERPWVWAVAFSPDGKALASGGQDQALRLWDASAGDVSRWKECVGPMGHPDAVRALAFSPDGATVATGCGDGVVRLWDVKTGRPKGPDLGRGHTGSVLSVAFSHDGKVLGSGGGDGVVQVWDAATGRRLNSLREAKRGEVRAVTFSPGGEWLATAHSSGDILLWDFKPWQGPNAVDNSPSVPGRAFKKASDAVWSAAFSPDGRFLASGTADGMIQLREVAAPEDEPQALRAHEKEVSALSFSQAGAALVSASWDAQVKFWDVGAMAARGSIPLDGEGPVRAVALSPGDRKRLVWVGAGGRLRAWDLDRRRHIGHPAGAPAGEVGALAFSPADRNVLAAGGADGKVRVWDLTVDGDDLKLRERPFQAGLGGAVRCLALSDDGTRLVGGGANGHVKVWDVASGREVQDHSSGGEPVEAVGFARDGESVLVWQRAGRVVKYGPKSERQSIGGPPEGAEPLAGAISHDEKRLAVVTRTSIDFWDLAPVSEESPTRVFAVPNESLSGASAMAFSPDDDGATLAVAVGGRIRVWQSATKAQASEAIKERR